MERTFAIIKPDAVAKKAAGPILDRIEQEGFKVLGMRLVHMSRSDAEGFYAVHKERPFFNDLVSFMSSGPSVVLALEAENAITRWRVVIGATNPEQAADKILIEEAVIMPVTYGRTHRLVKPWVKISESWLGHWSLKDVVIEPH